MRSASRFALTSPGGGAVSPTGEWSVVGAYAKGDIVSWLGSSFMALADVPAGGANPRTNTAAWMLLAQGGGEIAYSEATGNLLVSPVPAAAFTDVPGLSVVVPANSGPIDVEARLANVVLTTAAGTVAGEVVVFQTYIVRDDGIGVAMEAWQQVINLATAGKNYHRAMYPKRRLPNDPAQRSYKVQVWLGSNNGGHQSLGVWGGPGDKTPVNEQGAFDYTPSFIKARSA